MPANQKIIWPEYFLKVRKTCGIYQIKNKLSGKIYIGQSRTIGDRWINELNFAFHEYASNKALYRTRLAQAFRKSGSISQCLLDFEFSILEQCRFTELDDKERYWIKSVGCTWHNSYNSTSGGVSGNGKTKFKAPSDKVIEKIELEYSFTKRTLPQLAAKYHTSLDFMSMLHTGRIMSRRRMANFELDEADLCSQDPKVKTYWLKKETSSMPLLPYIIEDESASIGKSAEQIDEVKKLCTGEAEKSIILQKEDVLMGRRALLTNENFASKLRQLALQRPIPSIQQIADSLHVHRNSIQRSLIAFGLYNEYKKAAADEQAAEREKHRMEREAKKHKPIYSVRPLYATSLTTGEELYFDNLAAATSFLQGRVRNVGHIINCCRGLRKSAYGYKWRWPAEYNN